MKKIMVNENGICNELYYGFEKDFDGILGCKWIATTEGNSFTDCDCEDEELLVAIEAIIANEKLEDVRECDVEDYDYINDLIDAWGLR